MQGDSAWGLTETCYAQGGRPSVQISLLFPLGYISSLSPKTRKSRKKKKKKTREALIMRPVTGLNGKNHSMVTRLPNGASSHRGWCCVWEVHQWQTMSKCLVTHKINHHRSQVLGSGTEVFLHIRPSQRPSTDFLRAHPWASPRL